MQQTGTRESREYLPALRWHALTPLFDSVVRGHRAGADDQAIGVLNAAGVQSGEAVLDLGCGTGTLAIAQKRRCPDARVVGLDADPEVLARARGKALGESVEMELVEALSSAMPFADASFDVVLSTLFFHHLDPEVKRATLAEVARVLGARRPAACGRLG